MTKVWFNMAVNSNFRSIFSRFRDIVGSVRREPLHYTTPVQAKILVRFPLSIHDVGVRKEQKDPRLPAEKLFSKYFNLCDHNSLGLGPTSTSSAQCHAQKDLPWQYICCPLSLVSAAKTSGKNCFLFCINLYSSTSMAVHIHYTIKQ